MKTMKNNNVKIRKVPVEAFLNLLADLFDQGVDYIDIVGILDDNQDSIGIAFSREYMSEDMQENFDDITPITVNKTSDKIRINLSSNEDLNQII
jgi:hypothetical protein